MTEKYRRTPKELRQIENDMEMIFKYRTERELMQFLRKHGVMDEDPRFSAIVQFYRDLKRDPSTPIPGDLPSSQKRRKD